MRVLIAIVVVWYHRVFVNPKRDNDNSRLEHDVIYIKISSAFYYVVIINLSKYEIFEGVTHFKASWSQR